MNTWCNQQRAYTLTLLLCVTLTGATSCVKNSPTVPEEPPPPPEVVESAPPPAPRPTPRPTPPPSEPEQPVIAEDTFVSRSLEELNRESPLEPVFYGYDSSEVNTDARVVLDQNLEILRENSNWIITVEGHCDERGTAEYNLALGERRALAARDYLVGRGLEARRVRTVSYGKEFPFNAGHDDASWAANRRAHFVITDQ